MAMNGCEKIQDLCMLQVHGVSQLAKEIEECKGIEVKYYDELILHRNEKTFEIEGVQEEKVQPAKKIQRNPSIVSSRVSESKF